MSIATGLICEVRSPAIVMSQSSQQQHYAFMNRQMGPKINIFHYHFTSHILPPDQDHICLVRMYYDETAGSHVSYVLRFVRVRRTC